MGREKRRRQKYNEFLKQHQKDTEARKDKKKKLRQAHQDLKEAEKTLSKLVIDKNEGDDDWESESMDVEPKTRRIKSIRKKKAFIDQRKKKQRKNRRHGFE